ncbi:MAG: hypothetical protein DRO13_02065 [Thermoprotei archaeon]|nr:MAG: hypothetical protein DRO13_02065 [Thermoprotei archaeon]
MCSFLKFCIYCGTEGSDDNPVVGSVCLSCRIRRGDILSLKERELQVEMCKSCYSIRVGYRWLTTGGLEDAAKEVIYRVLPEKIVPSNGVTSLEIVGFEFLTEVSWRTLVRTYLKGKYGGVEFKYSIDVVVSFKPVKCPRCIMANSREYEAVVQIRSIKRPRLEKLVGSIVERDKRYVESLVDIVVQSNGIDLYFYDKGTARMFARTLARKLGGRVKIKENYEVAGMRSGVQRARLVISVRPSRF